ncbi:MAG: DUF4178 domain-containing protein [Acidobacteriota bacterium]
MGLFDRIRHTLRGGEATAAPASSTPTNLADLAVGWMVDYDLRTWQVTDHEHYTFNDGATADEWELSSGHDRLYLERSDDDGEVEWSISRPLPIERLEGVRDHILQHDDPPDAIEYGGRTFRMEWSVGGSVRPVAGGEERRLIEWELLDADEEHFLAIQQWGDTEFTASEGEVVQPFLFTHLLAGSPS